MVKQMLRKCFLWLCGVKMLFFLLIFKINVLVSSFVCIFALRLKYTALAVINVKINFTFLARLFVYLPCGEHNTALAVINVKMNFTFLARLFVYLR